MGCCTRCHTSMTGYVIVLSIIIIINTKYIDLQLFGISISSSRCSIWKICSRTCNRCVPPFPPSVSCLTALISFVFSFPLPPLSFSPVLFPSSALVDSFPLSSHFLSFLFALSSHPGKGMQAAAHYQQAVRLKPAHYVAMVNLGRLLRSSNENKEAESWYKRWVKYHVQQQPGAKTFISYKAAAV